jgi:hypothetical protein
MAEPGSNDRIIETCRRILCRQGEPPGRPSDEGASECVLLCNRVGPDLFDIKKGIAKVSGSELYNIDGRMTLSHATKITLIIE